MTKTLIENSGKPYTPEEIKEIKNLAKTKTPLIEISKKLGRSGGSIKNIALKHGINLK
jgi:hypothetical protein